MRDDSDHFDIYIALCVCILSLNVIYLAYKLNSFEDKQDKQEVVIQEFKNSERNCLIAALYHEARGEGKLGLKAVASVIYNRKNHPYFPSSYCGITNQYKQFSYTLLNKPSGEELEAFVPAYESKVYAEILTLSESMVNERFKPSLAPSVMWYTTKKVSNKWTKKKRVVAEIGNHRFYADKEGKI
jgi:spore germination cell wall hydrolase CwlJ-like protein